MHTLPFQAKKFKEQYVQFRTDRAWEPGFVGCVLARSTCIEQLGECLDIVGRRVIDKLTGRDYALKTYPLPSMFSGINHLSEYAKNETESLTDMRFAGLPRIPELVQAWKSFDQDYTDPTPNNQKAHHCCVVTE